MKKLFAVFVLTAALCFSQAAMTNTTLSTAITSPQTATVVLASATNVSANGFLFMNGEVMRVAGNYSSGTTIPVIRAQSGTNTQIQHTSGTVVYVVAPGNEARAGFRNYDHKGGCLATNESILPVINVLNGKIFDCKANRWGRVMEQYIAPTNCGTVQTTSTSTNTYITLGASGVFLLNSTSNAAAGTTTLVCDFLPPTSFLSARGAVLYDIVVAVGSQTTAPTSLGTSTLGIVTFPTPTATTQTASTVTPVAAGGTVTTVGPTTTVQTVTTAGAFLTFKHTYSSPVVLTTDLQRVHYTFPFLQSAGAVMTLNWPGLWVHYLVTEN